MTLDACDAEAEGAWRSLGSLEYVVETRGRDCLERWLVLRPEPANCADFPGWGLTVTPGCRIVVEAGSLRPVGVIPAGLAAAKPCAGDDPSDFPAAR